MVTRTEPKPQAYFEWCDAWVFAALQRAICDNGNVDFTRVIGCSDVLNHAILMADEIRVALLKFAKRGLIEFDDRVVRVTPLVALMYERIARRRGGLFSVVDNTLAVLNSPRTKLPELDVDPDVSFITEKFVKGEWRRFQPTETHL